MKQNQEHYGNTWDVIYLYGIAYSQFQLSKAAKTSHEATNLLVDSTLLAAFAFEKMMFEVAKSYYPSISQNHDRREMHELVFWVTGLTSGYSNSVNYSTIEKCLIVKDIITTGKPRNNRLSSCFQDEISSTAIEPASAQITKASQFCTYTWVERYFFAIKSIQSDISKTMRSEYTHPLKMAENTGQVYCG